MASGLDYEAPPSYDSVIAGVSYVTRTQTSQLSVVDFLAEHKQTKFPVLIQRANEWLRINSGWEAQTCESIEYKSKGGIPDVHKVTFTEYNRATLYVRGLRLWLIPRRNINLPAQTIGYFDMIPNGVAGGFNYQFERFPDVINRLNSMLINNPLSGSIITIETQPMKFSTSHGAVDPDQTHFTDFGFSVFVIRIFYEVGNPTFETVGALDFLPMFHQHPYDTIQNLIAMANQWASTQPNIRMVNCQTVCMKRKYGFPNMVDNTKMSIREQRSEHTTHYYRILRLFYVVIPETAMATMHLNPNTFTGPLTCKTFLPIQLSPGGFMSMPQFESTQQTLSRLSDWVQQCNVKILSVETCMVRMFSGAAGYGPDSTYFYNPSEQMEKFITIVRVYLDGAYPDPHISMSAISHRGWTGNPVRDPNNIPPANVIECCNLL